MGGAWLARGLRGDRSGRAALAAVGALAGLGCATPAVASDQTGVITSVAFAGGRALFWMNGTRTGTRPACDCCTRWELVTGDATSQMQVSLVMTAYAQGRRVALSGTGACVAGSSDTEGVYYLQSN